MSPSTARTDRVRKRPRYAAAGVPWVWLVDPLARTLECLRLDDAGHYVIVRAWENDDKPNPEPFEALQVELERWWIPATAPEGEGEAAD